jgi:hypothetical protein
LATDYSNGVEARQWLQDQHHAHHAMFEAGKEETLKLVGDLYGAGAEGVRVTDATKLDEGAEGELASTLVYKLPGNVSKRAAVMKVHNDTLELEGEERIKDSGQAYDEIVID